MAKTLLSTFANKGKRKLKKGAAKVLALLFRSKSYPLFGIATGYAKQKSPEIILRKGQSLLKNGKLIEAYDDELFELSLKRFFPKIAKIDRPVMSLAHLWQDAFFHWMYEVLPKLYQNEHHEAYFVSLQHPFQRQSLKLLGIKNIIDANAYDALIAPQIITAPSPLHAPHTLAFLREKFLPFLTRKEKKKIYISRNDAPTRRLINENELLKKFPHYEKVTLTNKDLIDQMNLFYNASHIIAPHGAALSHLAFCDPGTELLEIFSPLYVNHCYEEISQKVGVIYKSVYGKCADQRSDPDIILNIT